MPIQARRLIRKVRGGAQAHLLQTTDGDYYVVKFLQNPQHRRILVNELIASVFLRYLQIAQPQTAIVEITEEFLRDNPEVCIQLGSRRMAVEPGWHFGSRFPGDPSVTAVYDYVPDVLLHKVDNLDHFRGILVFDKWMSNADARQSIFFRANVQVWRSTGLTKPKAGFLAQMMDHGFVFNGPNWEFPDSPIQGIYFRPLVYRGVSSLDDFQPWLDQVRNFPEEVVDEAFRQVPRRWLDGDEDTLERLLEKLMARRRRIADLIEDCRRARPGTFPDWI